MPDRKLSARYPTDLPAWQKLKAHYRDDMKQRRIADLFARDKKRCERFSVQSGDLYLDYSKNLLNATTRKHLLALAKQANVRDAIEAMFAGEHINSTEDRAVLHVALRSKLSDQVALETPGVREIWQILNEMDEYVTAVHNGDIRGRTGHSVRSRLSSAIRYRARAASRDARASANCGFRRTRSLGSPSPIFDHSPLATSDSSCSCA